MAARRRNPVPITVTPFREGELRVAFETRDPKGTNPGLWSFLLYATVDALRRIRALRKVMADTRGFGEAADGWQLIGTLWLRSWPDTPEVYVETSRVHPALHGKKLGVYLYSAAADIASAMGRPIVSSYHDRSPQAQALWKSRTLRQHYDVRQDGAYDVLTTRSGPCPKLRRVGLSGVGR